MSTMSERYQQNLEAAVQERIDGPLVVATIGSPVGSMSHLFTSEMFNLGMSASESNTRSSGSTSGTVHSGDPKDIHLPQSFAVVVTATSVYFFRWKPFWGRVKIKKELVHLPREGLSVKIARGKASATTFLLLCEVTETRVAFEMATLGMAKAKAKVAEVAAAFGLEPPLH